MQKDVIYIDVEDDITAIIEKVKQSKEKVVALVPPKRIGVLQSAVNLRLLNRAGENANKHLVLITGNAALSGLAASAKIPVAKNLQSKPEIAEVPNSSDEDDDVIDGGKLPVGDHVADDESSAIPASKIEGLDIDGEPAAVVAKKPAQAEAGKKGIKVPDFGSFRKKIFIFGGLGVFAIIFLVWAIWFAPRATVIISAQTTAKNLSTVVSVGPSITTDADQAHLQGIQQQDKATQSIDFDATGTKDVGDKATGTVTFSTASIGDLGTTIPASTQLVASNGLSYVTTQSVTMSISNYTGASAGIVAVESGEKYNGASGTASGAPGSIAAKITGQTTGGTTKTVKVVTQADVDKAKSQLADQNTDTAKKTLRSKFADGTVIIDSSFRSTSGDPTVSPAVGQEATGKAKLTQETTSSIIGVAKAQLSAFLSSSFEKTLSGTTGQKIYDNGASTVQFGDFKQNDGDQAGSVNVTAVAQIGPKIDDAAIKQLVKGKRVGEIEGDLRAIDGVSDVEVKLSPFWVQGVPGDVNKITIEFKLLENK